MLPDQSISRSMVLESLPSVVPGVCKEILLELQTRDYTQDDIFAIHLALEEAVANAIKHGNKSDPDKKVKIDCTIDSKKVEIFITDQGNGFDPQQIPDPRAGENIYKADGRGLFLIRAYMDVAEFNQCGNSLHMVKYNNCKG